MGPHRATRGLRAQVAIAGFLLALAASCTSGPRGEREGALLEAGGGDFLAGNYARALYGYDRYLALNPDTPRRPWLHLQMGLCRNGRKEYDEAIREFDRALAAGGDQALQARARFHRAVAHNLKDRPEEALRDLDRIARISSEARGRAVKAAEFARIHGMTCLRAGDWIRGRKILQDLAASQPAAPDAALARRLLSFQRFAVQVAHCPDEKAARTRLEVLRRRGIVARAFPLPDRGGVSILVGAFARYDEGVRERDRLRARGVDGFILP